MYSRGFLRIYTSFVILTIVESAAYLNFIDCKKPSDNGNILIHENSTWLECKNKNLEHEHCIAAVTSRGADCVPHFRVKKRLDGFYNSWFTSGAAKPYYVDPSDRTYANCKKIKKDRGSSLTGSDYKIDCFKDLQRDRSNKINPFCSVKNRNVFLIEDKSWYACQNGVFHLQRCVKQKSDKYYCISKQKIEQALQDPSKRTKLNKASGTFCEKFYANPSSIMSNYAKEEKLCSDYEESTTVAAPAPIPTTTTTTKRTTTTKATATTTIPKPVVIPKKETPKPAEAAVPAYRPAVVEPEKRSEEEIHVEPTTTTTIQETTTTIPVTEKPQGPKIRVVENLRPYLGSQLIQPELEKCHENGVRSRGIWYQCNIPTKCVVKHSSPSPMCLSFESIEKMFAEYQDDTDLGPKAGWDDDRFYKIYGHLENGKFKNLYEILKASESGNYALFDFIACKFTNDALNDKNVTIVVNETQTKVSPRTACKIALQNTPFKQAFLEKYYKTCEDPPVYVE